MTVTHENLERLRKIPSVNELLLLVQRAEWSALYPQDHVVESIRRVLETVRARILESGVDVPTLEDLLGQVRIHLSDLAAFSLKRVVNATGIIVHTNLGRAPLSPEAVRHLAEIAGNYNNLEFDLARGVRGSREKHLEEILSRLVPAEASLVVNNNAAALLLLLNTFAEGKEVLVSRGELVEIGGSFRLPDIMKKSQAVLREVGTTNKTRLEDYRDAISDRTGLILVVHPSNFQIVGFTERPDAADLIALGASRGIPVAEDHGSGILTDLSGWGIPGEPCVADRVRAGFDAVCFSGDKILGGPQAGIVCGRKEWIHRMRKNPLFRVLRVDKMVYAALEATLRLYFMERFDRIPVLKMLSVSGNDLKRAADNWQAELNPLLPGASLQVEQTVCYAGGGVAPMKGIDSCALSLKHPKLSAQELAASLRKSEPPIVARIDEERVYFELRTLLEEDRSIITAALQRIWSAQS
ncbi:MAG TPA: L-seryl-tRNA(Sec) selenium transferase [Acidobacteriota bacterium]|nr:L-seryl-tRNA(Sec) selenium transferase [Acidobacteriota bacterium]